MKIIKTENFEIAVNVAGNEDSKRLAILLPGRLDTKDYANFVSHLDYLSTRDFLTVAIDPPYTWESPGDIANYSTTNYLKAVNELIEYFGNRPTLVMGHSRGGATAMLVSKNPAVTAIALVNAAYGAPTPPESSEIENGVLPSYRDLPPGDVRTKEQKRFDLPLNYFEDGSKHNPDAALQEFTGPKLIIHANRDDFVSFDAVNIIFDGLTTPKTLVQIDCTHDYRLFPEAIKQVNESLGQFMDSYLGS